MTLLCFALVENCMASNCAVNYFCRGVHSTFQCNGRFHKGPERGPKE